MIPPPFRYIKPDTAAQAVAILDEVESSTLLGGGQTLLNALKLDLVSPALLVDVSGITDMQGVQVGPDEVWIGAATTYAQIAADPDLQAVLPWVAATGGGLVDRQVRNRGTIAGNCCLNDATSNFPPVLAALDASFDLLGLDGVTAVAASDFFLGTFLTVAALTRSVVTGVRVPRPGRGTHLAQRAVLVGADSWALARAVVRLDVADDRVARVRVRLGCAVGSPVRLPAVEAALSGQPVTADLPGLARRAFDDEDVEFVGDIHGSADYRRHLAGVQLKRALEDLGHEIRAPHDEGRPT